jgi:hypothetical protein
MNEDKEFFNLPYGGIRDQIIGNRILNNRAA